jgi:hypothetical protein
MGLKLRATCVRGLKLLEAGLEVVRPCAILSDIKVAEQMHARTRRHQAEALRFTM